MYNEQDEWPEKRIDTIAQNGNDGDHYATLNERAKNYGLFIDQAGLSQRLKAIVRVHNGWNNLEADQKEALEMVLHKVARIVNGNPEYVDSWHDIAGYVTLVEERLKGNVL